MKITDAFLGEHAVFYAQFNHLEQTVPNADSVAQVKNLGAMLTAALASHAQLEEELLFQNLESYIGPGGPLAVMRMEHNRIEENLARLPGLAAYEPACDILLQTLQVAREHFAKEEQILYPLAERTLGGGRLSELGEQWAEARKVFIGARQNS